MFLTHNHRLYKDLGDGQSIFMVGFLMQSYILDVIMVNGYNVGETSLPFTFLLLFNRGQLLKERICSRQSRCLLLRVDSLLKGPSPQESKQKTTKIVPLCNSGQRCAHSHSQGGVPIHIHREVCPFTLR